MNTGNIIGFVSLGVLILINLLALAMSWGKITQRLTDLCNHVDKQNGRIGKLEAEGINLAKSNENRITTVETNQRSVMTRLDKVETFHYVEKAKS